MLFSMQIYTSSLQGLLFFLIIKLKSLIIAMLNGITFCFILLPVITSQGCFLCG